MLKRQRKFLFLFFTWLLLTTIVFADSTAQPKALFIDNTQLVSQQIDLLKNRLKQANSRLSTLKFEAEKQVPFDQMNVQLRKQIGWDISVARSNLDSIDIELTESQQTIARIEKHIQEIENQLNILNVFGLKVSHTASAPSMSALQTELMYQANMLELERTRSNYLQKINDAAKATLDLNIDRYRHVSGALKSQTLMRLKEEQEKSELNFQREQTYWLQQLNTYYNELSHAQAAKSVDKALVAKIDDKIFFANETVNLSYLQMLIVRYQDQLHQYKLSIASSMSINLLNKISDQTQLLGKQLTRVNSLLKSRMVILDRRENFLTQSFAAMNKQADLSNLNKLEAQYKTAINNMAALNKDYNQFKALLDKALQQELSSRQGMPGFGTNAWLDLGQELLWVPTLTFQVVKSLISTLYETFDTITHQWIMLLIALEISWAVIFSLMYIFLGRIVSGMADHELGHINLKWLLLKLLHRNLIDIAVITNLYLVFVLCEIPPQSFDVVIYLGFVWLFFKGVLTAGKLIIVEAEHNSAVIDIRLYRRLRWVLAIGGVITMMCVFLYQLPVVYEVKDLFNRLFLLYVFIVSVFLIKSWRVVPGLILPYIHEHHVYFRRVVTSLGLLIPVILLLNSAIGLFGYVNLVFTISWYESIFLLVMVGYLIVRGILADVTEYASYVLIRHVTNGWLWTEAFLKPFDKVLRIALFLTAWAVLFLFYGWDQQSPVVERLTKLLHYNLVSVLNTTITPLSILEVLVIISLVFWAARWTREFVYRFLLSRTKDMGLRNSIAILSQYATVITGFLIILRVLGIDYRTLSVVAGMFFFGVGLGLRDLFNNFACGFLLLIERPIRVGDIVTITNIEGEVVHIGSRAVTIRTFDHMELLVPNAEIFSKSFINWTARDHIVRTVLHVKTSRHDNPHVIQKLIEAVFVTNKNVLKEPAPEVYLDALTDEIDFEIRFFINIRQVKSQQSVLSEVLASIWDTFEQHKIKPPYPHRQLILNNSSSYPEKT